MIDFGEGPDYSAGEYPRAVLGIVARHGLNEMEVGTSLDSSIASTQAIDPNAPENPAGARVGLQRHTLRILEAEHPGFQRVSRFKNMRRPLKRIALLPRQRHPVDRIVGKEIEPFTKASLVEHFSFGFDEIRDR